MNIKDIGRVFDEMAGEYTSIMEDMVPHYRQLLLGLIEYLPMDFQPDHILELGCGNGNLTTLLMAKWPEANIHLVDASDEMLSNCQQRFPDNLNLNYEQNFFQRLVLPPSHYDLIIAGFALHHLEGKEKKSTFQTSYAALRVGGILCSSDLHVSKEDEPFHSSVLGGWKSFVFSNGRTEEDWEWVMDHYAKYDRPDAFDDQRLWLLNAGFSEITLSWNDGPWGCFHAKK